MTLSKLNRAIFEKDEFLLSRSFVQYLYPVYPHPSPGSLRVVKRLTLYWHSYPVEVTTAVKLLTYSGAQVFCQGEKTVVDFWLPLVTASLPPGYSIKLPVSPSFLSNLLQQDYKQCTWWRKTTRGRVVNNRQILAGFGWKQNVGIRGSHTFPTPPLSGETHMPLRDDFLTFWAKVLKHVGNCLQVSFCFNAKTFIKILL